MRDHATTPLSPQKQARVALVVITKSGIQHAHRLQKALSPAILYLPAEGPAAATFHELRPHESLKYSRGLRLVPCALRLDPAVGPQQQDEHAYVLFNRPLKTELQNIWQKHQHIVLFLALGAVVRLIAPLLTSKHTDPAIVVVDDQARFAVSVLSGHSGGANELAQRVASALGACPVITTASDVGETIAVDLLGKEWGWKIDYPAPVTRVSAALINHEPVSILQEAGEPGWWPGQILPPSIAHCTSWDELAGPNKREYVAAIVITDRILTPEQQQAVKSLVVFRPKSITLGIGCRRGVTLEEIALAVRETLHEAEISLLSVGALATADIKASEPALLAYAATLGVPLLSYQISELEQAFIDLQCPSSSAKVGRLVGTPGVSEPAALLAAAPGTLVHPKRKFERVTVAIARKHYS